MPVVISQAARVALVPGSGRGARQVESEAKPVNIPTLDDAQLLQRVGLRDRQAFALLYDRFSGVLYSTVFRVLNNHDEASDVLQDVFVQIWEKAGTYNPSLGKPFSWALTMARNKAIDRLRALRRRYSFIEEIAQEQGAAGPATAPAAPASDLFSPEQAARIRSAVATLPLEQRQAIEMAFLGGLTQSEIAA